MHKHLLRLTYLSIIVGFGSFLPCPAHAKERPLNVLFILVDGANADHFSSYGYHRKTTPNFDKIAREGVLFENALSQAWYTLPSHASIFTSKYPHSHNINKKDLSLPESEITLAEILRDAGYQTGAIVGGIFLDPIFGFTQGFNTYYCSTAEQPQILPGHLGRSHIIIPKAIQWLEENKDRPFFLFVHNYDLYMPTNVPHEFKMDQEYEGIADELLSVPRIKLAQTARHTYRAGLSSALYTKEVRLNDRDKQHIISDYDDGLTYSDFWHKKLFDKLNELKLADNTIIIITSDHGSDLLGHGKLKLYIEGSMYDEVLKVPLIVKHPGSKMLKGKKISSQVQLIDLMPTILDLLGITPKSPMEGKSLRSLLEGGPAKEINPYTYSGWGTRRSIRTNEWKLIYQNGFYELYHLKNDPGEIANLNENRPATALPLMEKLFDWSRRELPARKMNLIEMDPRMQKSLRDAGYW